MVLAHGSVLEAPALAVVIDQLGRFAGEKQGFLVVLLAKEDVEYNLWRQTLVTNSSTLAKYLNFKECFCLIILLTKMTVYLQASLTLPSDILSGFAMKQSDTRAHSSNALSLLSH